MKPPGLTWTPTVFVGQNRQTVNVVDPARVHIGPDGLFRANIILVFEGDEIARMKAKFEEEDWVFDCSKKAATITEVRYFDTHRKLTRQEKAEDLPLQLLDFGSDAGQYARIVCQLGPGDLEEARNRTDSLVARDPIGLADQMYKFIETHTVQRPQAPTH